MAVVCSAADRQGLLWLGQRVHWGRVFPDGSMPRAAVLGVVVDVSRCVQALDRAKARHRLERRQGTRSDGRTGRRIGGQVPEAGVGHLA